MASSPGLYVPPTCMFQTRIQSPRPAILYLCGTCHMDRKPTTRRMPGGLRSWDLWYLFLTPYSSGKFGVTTGVPTIRAGFTGIPEDIIQLQWSYGMPSEVWITWPPEVKLTWGISALTGISGGGSQGWYNGCGRSQDQGCRPCLRCRHP